MACADVSAYSQLCLRSTFIDIDEGMARDQATKRRSQSLPARRSRVDASNAFDEERSYVSGLYGKLVSVWAVGFTCGASPARPPHPRGEPAPTAAMTNRVVSEMLLRSKVARPALSARRASNAGGRS